MVALLIIVALFLLIMLLKISVDLAYSDNRLSLKLRIGPVPIQIIPKRKKAAGQKKITRAKASDKPKKKREKPSLQFILEIAKMLLHALERFQRGIHVYCFRLRFISGFGDPYNTAMLCGYANAAAGMLAPIARRAFHIHESQVEIGADFEADKPQFSGRLKVGFRLWHAPHAALAFAFEYLRYKRNAPGTFGSKHGKNESNTAQAKAQQNAVPAGT